MKKATEAKTAADKANTDATKKAADAKKKADDAKKKADASKKASDAATKAAADAKAKYEKAVNPPAKKEVKKDAKNTTCFTGPVVFMTAGPFFESSSTRSRHPDKRFSRCPTPPPCCSVSWPPSC